MELNYGYKMNKKGQELNFLGKAIVFISLFIFGGIIGSVSLPEFEGRFFISGLFFALAAGGFVRLIINWHH